jgi:hypothetical protein
MRREDTQNQTLFSYVRTDDRIPSNHPLRLIRQIADAALSALSGQFDAVYAAEGRPLIRFAAQPRRSVCFGPC